MSDRPSPKPATVAVVAAVIGGLMGAALTVRYYAGPVQPAPAPIPATPAAPAPRNEASTLYTPAELNDLAGWTQDTVQDALPALKKSCAVFQQMPADTVVGSGVIARPVQAWSAACAAVVAAQGDADLRAALLRAFTPYRVAVSGAEGGAPDDQGTFTGYYEAELNGSLTRNGAYQVPIYGLPRNLVTLDVKDFLSPNASVPAGFPSSFAGRVVAGDQGTQLKPYYTRAEIDLAGAIANDADVLAWADDPVAVHILHIQGSGRVTLPDGQVLRLGFAGSNGQAFRALGTILRQAGVLQTGSMSMIVVRDWLKHHADQATDLMNRNARYIFFRKVDLSNADDGPLGAENVSLTAGRSMAVDPRFLPLGAPIWLDTKDPDGAPFQRLMVAQDVGSAITGPIRGDIFWGHGEDAFLKAGRMRSLGTYLVFIPKAPPQSP